MKRMLVEYVRRPGAVHCSSEFINAVMKTFHGRKAKTDVEKLVKSFIQNQKVGVLIAVPSIDDSFVGITFAQWNQDMDTYDKEVMVDVALERLTKYLTKDENFMPKIPFEVARKLPAFMERCRRYYKGATFPKWTENYK